MIPNLATVSGAVEGCGVPVATEGKGGSNWAVDLCCYLPNLDQPGILPW